MLVQEARIVQMPPGKHAGKKSLVAKISFSRHDLDKPVQIEKYTSKHQGS